jgi:transposase
MQKFRDVLSRWESKELSALEAGELLGCSERQFRRYRDRYDEEGVAGLIDRRLGRASAKRVPTEEVEWMRDQYRTRHQGWSVKHFHEHLAKQHGFRWGYTWTKTQLHTAGLVERAARRGAHRRKRPRKPCEGMMLHQDASRFAWLADGPELDLIVTMDDATSTIYSAFLVEEEGTASTLRALLEVFIATGLPSSLYTDRGSHYFFTPKAGEAVDKDRLTQVGRALDRLGIEHIPAYSPEARGRSERMFGTLQGRLPKELKLAGIGDVAAANRFIRAVYLPRCIMLVSPSLRSWPRPHSSLSPIPPAWSRSCASKTNGSWRATTPSAMPDASSSCRKARRGLTSSKPASRCVSIPMAASRFSMDRGCWHAMTPTASPSQQPA